MRFVFCLIDFGGERRHGNNSIVNQPAIECGYWRCHIPLTDVPPLEESRTFVGPGDLHHCSRMDYITVLNILSK